MASIYTKIEPLDKDVQVIISETLSPAARSAILAEAARRQPEKGEQINEAAIGYVPTYKVYVDGAEGGSEDSVRPDGTIVYEFDLIRDLFAWIDTQLKMHSPVKSGRYQKSHLFYADGVEASIDSPPEAAEYVFLNAQPYARKIEGVSGKPPSSPQAPDGVYEAVAALARRQFGNLANVQFSFRSPVGGPIGHWAQSSSARALAARVRRGNPTKHTDWLTKVPAIVITLR